MRNGNEKLDWFPCNPAKLLGALAGMKAPKGYVYVVVLLRIYEDGGICRDSLDAIATRTRLNRRVVSEALDSLFKEGRLVRDGDGIINPVAAKVIADSNAVRAERSRAGKDGASRRWQKDQSKQQNHDGKPIAEPMAKHAHLQLQDSLFPNGNRRSETKPAPKPMSKTEVERKELFDRGKEILGAESGGLIQRLMAAKHGNIALARAAIEQASTMDNPRQYIGGILRGGASGGIEKAGFASLGARVRYGGAVADPGDLEPADRH